MFNPPQVLGAFLGSRAKHKFKGLLQAQGSLISMVAAIEAKLVSGVDATRRHDSCGFSHHLVVLFLSKEVRSVPPL